MNNKIPYSVCMKMTLKEIRKTPKYKSLSPLGKINKSGTYKYGNKSSANKEELCRIMNNPQKYQEKVKKNKSKGVNSSKRKRSTRKGLCLVAARKIPCKTTGKFKYEGVTTIGKRCCYKKEMSKKTREKRLRNASNK